MTTFVQLLLTGIMVGTIYGLMALGFVLIYKSCQIFNFATGEFVMVGAYLGWTMLCMFNLPLWMAVLATLAITGAIGYGLERFPLRPLIGQSLLSILMVTLGLAVLLRAITVLIWAPHANAAYPMEIALKPMHIFGIPFSPMLVIGFALAAILGGAFGLFFYRTRIGLHMRAAAEDHHLAQGMGIRVTKAIAQSWAIAFMVAAVGGIILGYTKGVSFGLADLGIVAIAAALAGGLNSIPGALIGGIIIGVFQSISGGYIGHGFKEVAPFIAIVLLVLIKPYGLFGLVRIERV